MPVIADDILKTREPMYAGNGSFYWRCANKAGDFGDIFLQNKHMIPWEVYHGMPGTRSGYMAEFHSRDAAMAALAHGVANPKVE